jgi:hypothetical protein
MTPILYVAAALAISIAGNVWLGSAYIEKREAIAALQASSTEQLQHVTTAAKACSTSVDNLVREEQASRDAVADAITKNAEVQRTILTLAKRALAAKPDNPNDLCGSADRYLTQQIRARRAAAASAVTSP